MNTYPAEIEDVVLARPRDSDVALIGMPSAKWGESLAWCRGRPGPTSVGPDRPNTPLPSSADRSRLAPAATPKRYGHQEVRDEGVGGADSQEVGAQEVAGKKR